MLWVSLYLVQLHFVQTTEDEVVLKIVFDTQLFALLQEAQAGHQIVLLRAVLREQQQQSIGGSAGEEGAGY